MIRFLAVVSVVVLGVAASSAEAVTKQFWYLGGVAQVSNYADPDRPAFQTGSLKLVLDEAYDASLSNAELVLDVNRDSFFLNGEVFRHYFYLDGYPDIELYEPGAEYSFKHTGANLNTVAMSVKFDAKGMPDSWNFHRSSGRTLRVNNGSDDLYRVDWGYVGAEEYADDYLTKLGYVRDTKAYSDLYCGSWAGEACAGKSAKVSDAWEAYLRSSGGGRWYDNMADYDAAVKVNEDFALLHPPGSYYDIPPAPVPLPGALGLLSGAVALLAGAGRVRRRFRG